GAGDGKAAAHQQAVAETIRCGSLDAATPGRIEVDVVEQCRNEMDLVLEVHVVDAGLPLEAARLVAEAALDVVRGLGLQPEVKRWGRKRSEGEKGPGCYALVDVGRAEGAGGAAEQRERVVDPVLDA